MKIKIYYINPNITTIIKINPKFKKFEDFMEKFFKRKVFCSLNDNGSIAINTDNVICVEEVGE